MKKFRISMLILLFVVILSFSYVFATENSVTANRVKNVMNGTENTVQNVAGDIGNGVKNAGNTISQGVQGVQNGMQDMGNRVMDGLTTDNTDYTATRTATEANGSFLGMNSTMFTWVIMAIVGLAIIGLVWIYARQHDESYND